MTSGRAAGTKIGSEVSIPRYFFFCSSLPATKAPEVYRALIEATAFGTRRIIDSFEAAGVPIKDIVACGGLPDKNKLLMQIYADVTRREFSIAASSRSRPTCRCSCAATPGAS